MGLTMSEKVQAARDRALLISQQDADAPRLTDRLDAQSLAVLVEAFDATRARLAEVERERDAWTNDAHNCGIALAASQARVASLSARLREVMHLAGRDTSCAHAFGAPCALCDAASALASAPGSTDALREVCELVARAARNRGWEVAYELCGEPDVWGDGYDDDAADARHEESVRAECAAIVASILKERSDDAPQGRGERGKEGGDEC